MKRYECPCCGFLTLSEPPPGTFEICPVCFWEDDNVQYDDHDYKGGANEESLNEAKRNFTAIGAVSKKHIKDVRKPTPEEFC